MCFPVWNLDTRDHFLAARRDSISTPLTPNAQSGFTQISLPSHLCSAGSCVNTHRPPALNKSPWQPSYTVPLPSTWGLRWQLYKCWQSVPEQHWFCSNQSRDIETHGKWHCPCAIAYISALIVAGQTRPGPTGGLVSWVVRTAGKHQRAVCSLERCGRPSCHPYLKCEWTNLILVQRKQSPFFQTLHSAVIQYETETARLLIRLLIKCEEQDFPLIFRFTFSLKLFRK